MQLKNGLALLCLFTTLALGQNSSPTATKKSNQSNPQVAQEQFELRRQNFASGHQLLLDKRVPFDPDELLRDGWSKNRKTTLDNMPEMHESRK